MKSEGGRDSSTLYQKMEDYSHTSLRSLCYIMGGLKINFHPPQLNLPSSRRKIRGRGCWIQMHPVTHLLFSWTIANVVPLQKRDRALVTIAGVIPDVDGMGLVAELITRNSDRMLAWYSEFHHLLAHNIGFAILVFISTLALARQRLMTVGLAIISFHLHLVGDLLGSGGPDGYQWPISYLLPFWSGWQATWAGQWQLNAWPNVALSIILLALTLYLAWKRGYSPVELIATSADRIFVESLRNRFGDPRRTKEI